MYKNRYITIIERKSQRKKYDRKLEAMTKKRIMVVEDEGIVAMDIRFKLNEMGYEVPAVVFSGEKAVEKALELHPDLILMDIKLKGKMDGVEAVEKIKCSLDIPVVYLTAYADNNTIDQAKMTEPAGVLIKPFETEELYKIIEEALGTEKNETQ